MNNQPPPPVIATPTPNNQPPPVVVQPTPNTQYLLKRAEEQYAIALLVDTTPWMLFGWLIFIPLFTIPVLLLMIPFDICAYFLRRGARAMVESTGVDFYRWHRPIGIRDGIISLIVMGFVLWCAWQIGGQFMLNFLKWVYGE